MGQLTLGLNLFACSCYLSHNVKATEKGAKILYFLLFQIYRDAFLYLPRISAGYKTSLFVVAFGLHI